MNKAQRILTFICLSIFVLTLIRFPWDTKSSYHNYAMLWLPPHDAIGPNWSIVAAEWISLILVYAAVFLMLRGRGGARQTRR